MASPHLIWVIPTLGRPLHMDWAIALKGLNPPININYEFSPIWNMPVADARNAAAKHAIERGAKFLFFLGDDTIPPPHALRQLLFRMGNTPSAGCISGVYCSKSDPPAPLVFKEFGAGTYWDWRIGEFFTGMSGMDCTLIRVEALADMRDSVQDNWFKTVDTDGFLDGKNNAESWTEDLYFFHKMQQHGKWESWIEGGIICKHYDANTGKMYTLPAESLPVSTLQATHEKRCLDLGCGPQEVTFPDHDVIRIDIDERWNPDYRCDIRQLPFENESMDMIYSSHVMEHFGRWEIREVATEWFRVLKKGGTFRFIVPNIEWTVDQDYNPLQPGNHAANVLYGGQTSPYDFHKIGFTEKVMRDLLNQICPHEVSFSTQGYNLIAVGKKL